jgi:signal transduction histidine kinase
MKATLMELTLFIIYFFYGLAFFTMGLAMALESWSASSLAEARVLLPLAAFGLIHGTHEWIDSYVIQAHWFGIPIPAWLPWLRLGLLVASFLALAVFGVQSLRQIPGSMPLVLKRSSLTLAVFICFIITSCGLTLAQTRVSFLDLLNVLSRYLLAFPASALASLGLFYTGRSNPHLDKDILRQLDGAAIGFAGYALTQLFVPPLDIFPANVLNTELFQNTVGVPIQLVRTLAAGVIMVCLLRAARKKEEVRRVEFMTAQQARIDAMEQQQELRRELLQHTVHAQEEERTRIARELHDETAQTLSAFTLELAALQDRRCHRSDVKSIVDHLQSLSRDMSQGLYRMVHDLRPAQLDDLGLVPALRFLAAQDLHPRGMEITFEVLGKSRRLDPLIETVLFRVGQEALTNLARHANVQQGHMLIDYTDRAVTLRVSDRGRGFDPLQNFHPPHGWGLAGMKERVEAVGGTLTIHSAPGEGTLIEVHVPLKGKESK